MKIRRKPSKKKNKNLLRKEQSKKVYKRWTTRPRKYSRLPYLITVSFFRRNIFFTAADFQGRIKVWTNAGRFGFKGRNKTEYMAIITVTQGFLKKVWNYGIRYVFFKFKNFRRSRNAIRKALRMNKKKKQYRLKFLGIWTELHISFNGCRHKKLRRKRKRRKARRRILR